MTHKRINWFLAAVGVLALAAALPLLAQPGLLNTRGGGDSPFLLQRLQQLETALRDGHFPVRWMRDANYGYGYPFFNFYAPLSIYITAVFRFIGFSYVGAIKASQVAGFLTAALGMYWLARRWWGNEWVGVVTAVAYTVAPFHMVNVYVRGDSLAEFWAMAWYPWVILAADSVVSGQWSVVSKGKAVAGLALAYAALTLSHNISALIFSPFLLLYVLIKWSIANSQLPIANCQSPIVNRKSLIVNFILSLLLGLGLAAWFFVPALGEQDLAQLGPVTEGYFHYSNHFRGTDLVQGSLWFDYDVSGGGAFRMGLVQAVTAVLGLLVFIAKARTRGSSPLLPRSLAPLLFTALALLVATFMITPLSRPLWNHLPLLPFTQFPWRFLSVQAFAGALAAGGLALLPGRRMIVPLTLGLLLASGLGELHPDYLPLSDADVTAEKLAQYEWFTSNIGSTISAEYLPPTVTPRPYSSSWLMMGQRHVARALTGEADSEVIKFVTDEQVWQVTAVAHSTLEFPTMAWPGWVAEIDGAAVEIRPSPGGGLITVDVPPGTHTVSLHLTRTPIRRASEWASLLALLVVLWLLWGWKRPSWRKWAFAVGGLALTVLFVQLWPRPELPASDLTWDFAQMGYLHHDTAGVPFDNGWRLMAYSYSAETVAAGDVLRVTMVAENVVDTAVTLALLTPAANRPEQFPGVQPFVAQTHAAAEAMVFELPIPANAPAGLFVPRLTVAGARPLMPSGQTRGDVYLRPIRVEPVNGDQYSVNSNPYSELDVRAVGAQLDDGGLAVQLAWWTERPLTHNYNVSLRLRDGTGQDVAQFDTQPGYGFVPTSSWAAGQWVNDWLTLPLPEPLPGVPPYHLLVNLYEVGGETVLLRRLGALQDGVFAVQAPVFAAPQGVGDGVTAVFTENGTPFIQLRDYAVQSIDGQLTVTLVWESLATTPKNYTRFVHVLDVQGQLITQDDAMPQANSYPTSQWQPGEFVVDTVSFPVPADDYQVVVGFYENLGDMWPRVTAVAPDGLPFTDDAVPLVEENN
ncbi:MAG: hypothetical protein H6662_06110 [Ardenticatenaceae bacterium]|nr:hypothetical protein [Anaerolineales bacterium]MCB8921140.1 hypothetical protein [Ardenticatenaceae bacterium]MCB8990845.1 hypothetical protein [Ardenticatenaceae bacterium]MCB9004461.1 hypothetical protein [Ardenticatenaceae bacterium]